MRPTSFFLALSTLPLAAASIAADTFYKAGLEQTFGSNSYRGTYGYADIGSDLHFKPAFELFRSNATGGAFKTLSGRAIYDAASWEASLLIGGTLKTNGYSNRFVGLEGIRKLSSGAAPWGQDYGSAYWGGGLTHTTHTDDFQTAGTARGRFGQRVVVQRAGALNLGQTDLKVFGGATLAETAALSGSLAHSFYSQNLDNLSARGGEALALSGVDAIVSGFPDTSVNVRAELTALELASPYLSYTRTTFKLEDAPSNAYVAGVYFSLKALELKLAYELYKQNRTAGQNYFTVGISAQF